MHTLPQELYTLGNKALFRLPKTGFFCSRDYPAAIERPTLLWAMQQRYEGCCIVSGFHARLEQAILRYFLRAEWQPLIYALGRGIQPNTRFEYETPVAAGCCSLARLSRPCKPLRRKRPTSATCSWPI
jgi:hypothetical protein